MCLWSLLPLEVGDEILSISGPISMAHDSKGVACRRIQRTWRRSPPVLPLRLLEDPPPHFNGKRFVLTFPSRTDLWRGVGEVREIGFRVRLAHGWYVYPGNHVQIRGGPR